jgi:hypothetical protein
MKKLYVLFFLISASFTCVFSQVEGVWQVAPEANSLAVGPTMGDFSWFAISDADVVTRACFYDDKFAFAADGSFYNIQDGSTWVEAWQGIAADGCDTPVAPHDGSNPATWSYDASAGTITLTGVGAHLGLAKVINGSEITSPSAAPASITYPVVLSGDRMTIDINFGAGFWHFVLVRTAATSVVELVDNQFSFYPNPATSEITVNSDEQIEMFTIRDITGKVLVRKTNLLLNETIDTSALPAGMYILESRAGNQKSVKKLVIN